MFMEKYADIGGKAGKLKLVIYDTRGENTDAINLSRKLMDSDQVGAIIGLRLLGEPDAPRRMVGAGAIVAGIFALALG